MTNSVDATQSNKPHLNDEQQYTLEAIIDGCSEVIRLAIRSKWHGLDEVENGQELTNIERMHLKLSGHMNDTREAELWAGQGKRILFMDDDQVA